jgi:hypothetical protein
MGTHHDYHITHVLHRWRRRAQKCEAAIEDALTLTADERDDLLYALDTAAAYSRMNPARQKRFAALAKRVHRRENRPS